MAALDAVTLTLPTGSFTAVMRPSGSGKSTILNCAAGLATPTSGRVVIGSHDITRLSPDELTRFRPEHVGFVFQAYNLVPHLRVADNVALPMMPAGARPVVNPFPIALGPRVIRFELGDLGRYGSTKLAPYTNEMVKPPDSGFVVPNEAMRHRAQLVMQQRPRARA